MRLWLLAAVAALAPAQNFTDRGFFDFTGIGYPQAAPNDSGRAVGEVLFRYEAFYKAGGLRVAAGIDARTDSHRQVERLFHLSLLDRERQRPAFDLRRLSLAYSRGKLTVEAGRQFIRWGRTDIVTPTDRFAPQDYLNPIDADLLAVTAGRVSYGTQANSIDLVYSPRLTPSRIPLLNQRWAVLPESVSIREQRPDIPNGPQWGARFNHIGAVEWALSTYRGYDYFPLFRVRPEPYPPALETQRFYPAMRMYGGDVAVPLRQLTFRGEAASFTSPNALSDNYILYVAQLERQTGEWSFIGGYAGQAVTRRGSGAGFSEMRGLTKAFIARAGYTIDVNRGFSLQAAVRQNGQGVWLRPEYSQALGQHWRLTLGAAWIHGSDQDFIGQYHRNTFAIFRIRYSF